MYCARDPRRVKEDLIMSASETYREIIWLERVRFTEYIKA